jgi:4-hydroxy-2-oxoglutarate aldolase
MYNFPGVSGGIDLDSDLIVDIVKAAPNICGIKLTCANVGKLTRITARINDPEFGKAYPRKDSSIEFTVIDGIIDFLLPSVAVGSGGAISGLANIAPVRTPCLNLANAM